MIELYNADCLQKLKDLSSNSVDLILCDLPFGCLTQQKGATPFCRNTKGPSNSGCPWDIALDLPAFWEQIKRVRKNEHTPTLHFTTTRYGYELISSNTKEFRYDLIWDKGRGISFLSANRMPMRSHESIYVFSKSGSYYNRVDISGNFTPFEAKAPESIKTIRVYKVKKQHQESNDGTKRCALSVIKSPHATQPGRHPTEKPVELYKFLIERYCPAGGTVLDPTFGSGNSGLACQLLGRNYIGIEKDKTFFDKALSKLLGS